MEHTNFPLGGPGPGCSVMRLRRLAAGELSDAEGLALRDHLEGCARCQLAQQDLAEEREALARNLPFPAFAANVAEKLAAATAPKRRPPWIYVLPLALAATFAAVALPVALQRPVETPGNRTKGAVGATLFVQDARGTRQLEPGEPVAAEAHLSLSLRPSGYPYAAAALVEGTEISPLFVGAAKGGPLGSAFAWTGTGQAKVVVWFSHTPLLEDRFVSALREDRPEPEVATVALPLMR